MQHTVKSTLANYAFHSFKTAQWIHCILCASNSFYHGFVWVAGLSFSLNFFPFALAARAAFHSPLPGWCQFRGLLEAEAELWAKWNSLSLFPNHLALGFLQFRREFGQRQPAGTVLSHPGSRSPHREYELPWRL